MKRAVSIFLVAGCACAFAATAPMYPPAGLDMSAVDTDHPARK